MSTQHHDTDDEMPTEIDFSKGRRGKFHRPGSTMKLPAEPADQTPAPTDDPAFGMWRDRQDMADVAAYVRRIRAPRFKRDGSRDEPEQDT
jgi:hypothetical protein